MRSSHAAPPRQLLRPLEIDPMEWTNSHVYDLVTSLVIPRPVAWVSTLSLDGHRNLAPYSYFNLVADIPPHVAFSSIGVKDTLRNVRATREFVLNFAPQSLLAGLDATAAALAPDQDEFEFAGLTPVSAVRVSVPRVSEAAAHMECVLTRLVRVGNGTIVIGRVVHIHVSPCVWRDGCIDPELLDPVVRLSRRYGVLAPTFTPQEEPSPHVLA